MAQVLIIHDNLQIGQMYSMNLGLSLGLDVIVKDNISDVRKLLKIHPHFDLIICKSHLKSKEVINELIDFIEEIKIQLKLTVISNEECELPDDVSKFPLGGDYPQLIDHVSKLLEIDVDFVKSKSLTEFQNISVDIFHSLKISPCDIYQRSKRKLGEYHFVKKLLKGTEVTQNEVLRYQYEGITQLYVKNDQYEIFINSFSAAVNKLLDNESLSIKKRMEVTSSSMKTVKQQIQHLGLSEGAITTAQKTMKSIMLMVNKSSSFKKILDLLLSGRPGYHFNHCQITTYLCSHIVLHMDQGAETTTQKGLLANIDTLGFVSFFHDITLVDPKLSAVRSDKELKLSNFSEKEKQQVLNHSNEAVVLLEKFPNAPIGASAIIRQHHGARNGFGFPLFFSQDISPLAIIYIIAQDMADRILARNGQHLNIAFMISEMREKFKPSLYQKAIDSLNKLNFS